MITLDDLLALMLTPDPNSPQHEEVGDLLLRFVTATNLRANQEIIYETNVNGRVLEIAIRARR